MPTLRDVHIPAIIPLTNPSSSSPLGAPVSGSSQSTTKSLAPLEPGTPYLLMQPERETPTPDAFLEWASTNYPLHVSPIIEGLRFSLHFDGQSLAIFFADTATSLSLPLPISETRPFIVEGEFAATRAGSPLHRLDLAAVASGQAKATPHFYLRDLPYLSTPTGYPKKEGGDVYERSFSERLALLRTLKLPPSTFTILPQIIVVDQQAMIDAVPQLMRQPLSEGVCARQDSPYVPGLTPTSGEVTRSPHLRTTVLAVQPQPSGVVYRCGLKEPESYTNICDINGTPYVDLGTIPITQDQHIPVGATLNVRANLIQSDSSLTWDAPTPIGPGLSRPSHTVAAATQLSLPPTPSAQSDNEVDKTISLPIFKADEDQRLVYGVVLAPGVPDSQGDIMTPADIQEAAHNWLIKSRLYDYQHVASVDPDKAAPVESYILPADLSISDSKILKAGTWILVSKILDDSLWAEIKAGEINAYSIRGYGKRRPITEGELAKLTNTN